MNKNDRMKQMICVFICYHLIFTILYCNFEGKYFEEREKEVQFKLIRIKNCYLKCNIYSLRVQN